MNNEQLIEQLKNLKSHLPEGELDSTRLDTEKSISELESKLADNSNYESKGAAFFNAQRRSELKDSVGKATASLVESQNNAVELQNKITVAQSQIEDIPNIVTDLEDKLTVTGRELVSVGNGNNSKDGFEGGRYKNVFGTYLHGSLLPKNPHFADYLISLALEKRYGEKITLS